MLNTRESFLIRLALILFVVILVLSLGGCASPGKRTAIGAGAGAATGAAVGGLTGGWKGAAVGAATGAAVGGAVGNYLDKQADELKEVAETKRTENGILVKLKNDLLFHTDSAALKAPALENLSKLGRILAKYPDDRIRIEGYTDSVGNEIYNEKLSVKRAEAVKNTLVGNGVSENQMLVAGLGEEKPIASNRTSQGRSLNRRVELHIDVPQAEQG